MRVRANAETPLDAETARKFGAEGIGLCRTEHMFFDPERIGAVRADDHGRRRARPPRRARQAAAVPARGFRGAVPHHGGPAGDDPPARPAAARVPAARATPSSRRSPPPSARTWRRCAGASPNLAEANPMLGHRGCRLGITYPEIYEMQARAIFEGAHRDRGGDRQGAGARNHDPARRHEEGTGDHPRPGRQGRSARCSREAGRTIEYSVGTMIELPRAALTADEHRRGRGLLQLRHQRPDADRVRPVARRRGQVPARLRREGHPAEGPVRLDRRGGRRQPWSSSPPRRAASTKPDLKLGICGEHGGDPASIAFCEQIGLDYVSCSPYRVPVARLAAAQAALGSGTDRTA